MQRRFAFWVLTILVLFVAQVTLSGALSLGGVSPNLLLLGTIFFALIRGPGVGEWAGFCWGLLSDMSSISLFGSQTFMMTLVGYLSGRLRGQIDEQKPLAQMTLVGAMSAFYVLGLLLFENIFGGAPQRFRSWASFWEPAYSALVSPVLFWLLQRWSGAFFRSRSFAREALH